MPSEIILQTLLSGVLTGLIYALVATGLTIVFGVMDIINFSHGEFMMFGMYSSFWLYALYALDPLMTLPLTALFLFGIGVAVYRVVISRITYAPMVSQIFTTFGLMILFRGIAQFFWKPDHRAIEHSAVSGTAALGDFSIGLPQIAAGIGAVLVTLAVLLFFTKTRTGAALEATAADKDAARLMGIDSKKMFALAWGIGAACAGVAGALLSTFTPVFPTVGADFILIAFVVVNLGGFGSITGALIAGVLVGIVEVLGGFLVGPPYKLAIVLGLFLLVLMFRPQGLMGKA